MAGNGFAIIAAISNTIATFILQWQTSRNHENITNAELDWKNELEKRELIQIGSGIGATIQRRTQLKYKKERIGMDSFVSDNYVLVYYFIVYL